MKDYVTIRDSMSTSPKGIKATDKRVNYLSKAKQTRYNKLLKVTSSRNDFATIDNPNF